MTCDRIEELLPAFVDDDLPDDDRALVASHLDGCRSCADLLARLRQVDRLVAAWPALPGDLSTRLPSIDARVERRLRRERGWPVGLFARQTLRLAGSVAAIVLLLVLGTLTVMLGRGVLQSRAVPSPQAFSARARPIPAPATTRVGLRVDQLSNVVKITVLAASKATQNTVTDSAKITPVLDVLRSAHFVRQAPSDPGAFASGYLVQLTLHDGTSFEVVYLPNHPDANLWNGPDEWWDAPGLDAALAPLLPAPLYHDGTGWSIARDVTISQAYGWAPVGNYVDRWPRLSPDGTKLAYLPPDGSWKSADTRLVVRDLATGSERDVTPESGYQYSSVAWSPDGKSLAFVKYQPHPSAAAPSELWRIDVDGQNPRRLYRRDATRSDARGPSISIEGWSQDGQAITIGGTIFDGLGPDSIQRVRADGSGVARAIGVPNVCDASAQATWNGSPAFLGGDALCLAASASGVSVVRIASSGKVVSTVAAFPPGNRVAEVSVSPDDRWILAETTAKNAPAGDDSRALWLVASSGGNLRRISGQSIHLIESAGIAWSRADRAYVVGLPDFVPNVDDGFLYELDAARGVAQIVTTDWRAWNVLAATPDARQLVVLRGSGEPSWEQAELHLIELAPPPGQIVPTPVPTLEPTAKATASPTEAATTIPTLPGSVASLAIDPVQAQTVYALLATNQLYRSDDAGQTWRRLPLPSTGDSEQPGSSPGTRDVSVVPQHDLVILSERPNRVFVAADHVLYRSDDQGASWTAIEDAVYAWTVADAAGTTLYVSHEPGSLATSGESAPAGIYSSTDGGTTWRRVYEGSFPPTLDAQRCPCNHEGITTLLADPRDPNRLYAGTDFGVYQSADGGKTWRAFGTGLPATKRAYRWTPVLTAGSDGSIYLVDELYPDLATARAEVARLAPGASSWTEIDAGILNQLQDPDDAFHGVKTLIADPAHPGTLYLGTTHGLLVSNDRGATWKVAAVPGVGAVYRVAVVPDASGAAQPRLYLWTDIGLVKVKSP